MAAAEPCLSCGEPVDPDLPCPHCGADRGTLARELAAVERQIADLSSQDVSLQRERTLLSRKMQAAMHRKTVLANAQDERVRRATARTKRGGTTRRRPPRVPPTAPRQRTVPRQAPVSPPIGPPPPPGHPAAVPPEASSRSVQNILLGLGGLLLAVAAVVFAALAISTLDTISRALILFVATVAMLIVPVPVARRGLTATAETVAAVALLLVPLDGYALWTIDQLGLDSIPAATYFGLVSAATAAVAAWYAQRTRLSVPRYVTVFAVQPVLPLLAYEAHPSATGWALVLSALAAVDLVIARLLPTRLAGWAGVVQIGNRMLVPAAPTRPEGAPEEPDAVVTVDEDMIGPGRPRPPDIDEDDEVVDVPTAPAEPESIFWLRELTWILYGLAFGTALAYAVGALARATTVPPALAAAVVLLLAAGIGVAGAASLRRRPLPDVAGGLMTLAIIGAAGRVAAVAMPGRAMLVIAAVVALTGTGVRALPASTRRGPQIASAIALAVVGVVVAGAALRAAVAPVRAALPVWHPDLAAYPGRLADAVGATSWQLVVSALLLTIAAALALPAEIRRESAVAGAALTALSAPASLGLSWYVGPLVLVLSAIGIGVAGLAARNERGARAHAIGAAVTGAVAAGASLAHPALTAGVLTTLAIAAMVITAAARLLGDRPAAREIEEWATGAAAFAVPGAVATVAAAMAPAAVTPADRVAAAAPVLAVSFLAACLSLGYAALTLVADRHLSPQLSAGAGLAALAVTAAAFAAPGATVTDNWVGALVMVAAILLFLAPSIDAGRRADRNMDGPDFAAAAVTAALVASLARIIWLVAPGSGLVAAALLVLVVAVGVRALPDASRRGPTLGVTLGGAVVAAIAGYEALRAGMRVLVAPGPLWNADLSQWPAVPGPDAWQAPVALLVLAVAAAIVMPPPSSYDVGGVLVGLATIGAPVALGLPWWSPVLVGGGVAAIYATAAVVARDPRAGRARAVVATVVALHAVGAGLARPWTTAAALLLIALLGAVVAILGRIMTLLLRVETEGPGAPPPGVMPAHLAQIGGAGLAGSLLALPGALAAMAAGAGRPADVVLAGALAASSLGLAVVAAVRTQIPQYLPYATLGISGGATVTAVVSLGTDQPAGVYAAAAALLAVVAELIREHTPNPTVSQGTVRRWSIGVGGPTLRRRAVVVSTPRRWAFSPPMGALAASALPTAIALVTIAPALVAALVDPYATTGHRWEGPPEVLLHPSVDVDRTSVLAALLLTVAAALAAVGFSERRVSEAFPVVLPGIAVTLLIAPIALRMPWPASTMAALVVFTVAMLGVALTPPPPATDRARPLHVTRRAVFVLGLAAGSAGLSGSLATKPLTLFTLGGAVGVGLTAGLFGRTQTARVLGWLFAAVFAQLFVLTAGIIAGLAPHWSAFGVLAVGAALLVISATLPRLGRPEAIREAAAVEWSGYAAALLALALAYGSLQHVAGLLAAWGAVLGIAGTRPGRRDFERRALFWGAVVCEIVAWWLMMSIADVALPEAYTLPFAALALLVGVLELRHRPELGSWTAYGPALIAAFGPTLVIVLTTDAGSTREILLLLGAVATLIAGSMRRQRAPVVIGAVVTAITALHALAIIGPWLMLIPVGLLLLVAGANSEKRRRDLQRLRGAFTRMR